MYSPWLVGGHASTSTPPGLPSSSTELEHEVSGVLVRVLADVAQQYGVSPEALLGDRITVMCAPPFEVRISLVEYADLFDRAIRLTGEPALGLICGLSAHDASYDLMAPLVSHMSSLRRAIQEVRQFSALILAGVHVQLSEPAESARLTWRLPRLDRPFDRTCSELTMGGVMRMLRAFGCTPTDIRAVYFEHRRPAHDQAYDRAFEGTARFSQDMTGVELGPEVLDRPNLHGNPALQDVLHAEAERTLARLTRPTRVADRMRSYLRTHDGCRPPKMGLVAHALGMSVRSLRRRLDEEGESYRGVVQEALRERACRMLRNPERTVQEVGAALGFADVTVFHRAFKRWTGATPADYRERASLRDPPWR